MSLALVGLVAVFIFVQVPLWGVGPTWLKKIWTKIIRFFLRGDKRSWNWTEIEPGLYVGSLPRLPEDLKELQTAPHNLGGIVSLVEPWEVQVSGEVLQELGIEWLLLPTPDYSAPTMKDVEMAVQFIDRQVDCPAQGCFSTEACVCGLTEEILPRLRVCVCVCACVFVLCVERRREEARGCWCIAMQAGGEASW